MNVTSLRKNIKKTVGALAIAITASVAMVGATPASAMEFTRTHGLGGANINMGRFQGAEKVEITNDAETSHLSRKVGLSSLVKEYTSIDSLDIDALTKNIAQTHWKNKFNSDVDAAFSISNGRRSPYGSVGCVETVTYAGSYYSPALKDAFYCGIVYVPTLLSNLAAKGYAVEPFNGFAEKGDLLVYGNDDHVVIADGKGGCFGNSSSRQRAMYYSDASRAWCNGQLPSKIVRMS